MTRNWQPIERQPAAGQGCRFHGTQGFKEWRLPLCLFIFKLPLTTPQDTKYNFYGPRYPYPSQVKMTNPLLPYSQPLAQLDFLNADPPLWLELKHCRPCKLESSNRPPRQRQVLAFIWIWIHIHVTHVKSLRNSLAAVGRPIPLNGYEKSPCILQNTDQRALNIDSRSVSIVILDV